MIHKGILPYFATVFLAATLSANLALAGPDDVLPSLKSEDDKIALLVQIKHEIPELFSDAAKFDIDLLGILDDEKKLVAELEKIPRFNELMKVKLQNLLEIRVQAKTSLQLSEVKISPESVQEWKSSLQSTLKEIKSFPNWWKPLFGPPPPSPSALLGGVIASLSPEQKKTVSAAIKGKSSAEILTVLQQHLPQDMPDGFRFAQAGFAQSPSKTEVIHEFRARLEATKVRESRWALFSVLASSEPQNHKEAQARIEALNIHDLEHFSDRDAAIEKILPTLPILKEAQRLSESIAQTHKSFVRTTETTSAFKARSLVLHEMPPLYDLFRGCTAGDCSSQYSFPYPNDPHERGFFVSDENGRLLGNVSTTEVTSNGKKALYLITVAGSHMGTADAEMIFHAFDANKKAFGVESILLPEESRLDSLINFPPIRASYAKYADGKTVPVEYQDLEIRKAIEGFESESNTGTYDHHDKNSQGHIFRPDGLIAKSIETSTSKIQAPSLILTQPKQSDLIEFALDMNHSGNKDVAERVFKSAGLTPIKSQELTQTLVNKRKQPLEKWLVHLNALLSEVHAESLMKQDHLLYQGRLSAPDAFAPEHLKTTLSQLTKDFSTYSDYSEVSEFTRSVIGEHIEVIKNHPPIRDRIIKKISETQGNYGLTTDLNLHLQSFGIPNPGTEFLSAWIQNEAGQKLLQRGSYKELIDILWNKSGQSIEDWQRQLKEQLSKFHMETILKNEDILYRGRISARDAFTSPYIAETLSQITERFSKSLEALPDDPVNRLLRYHVVSVKNHKPIRDVIIRAIGEAGKTDRGAIRLGRRLEELQIDAFAGDLIPAWMQHAHGRDLLIGTYIAKREIPNAEIYIRQIIETGSQESLKRIAQLLVSPHSNSAEMRNLMALLIGRANESVRKEIGYALRNPLWNTPERHFLIESLSIADPAQRRAFLEKHLGKSTLLPHPYKAGAPPAHCLGKVLQGL